MRELLDSGVHFGHQTRRWNPKMKRFIFTERNGIYIIDIQQSLALIDSASLVWLTALHLLVKGQICRLADLSVIVFCK